MMRDYYDRVIAGILYLKWLGSAGLQWEAVIDWDQRNLKWMTLFGLLLMILEVWSSLIADGGHGYPE